MIEQTVPRWYRRKAVVAVVTTGALGAVVFGTVHWMGRADGASRQAQETVPVQTAAVVRTDLSTSKMLPGVLGFGASRPLTSAREGTVTWLPASGATVTRGKQLYRVDDEPVPLFYGGIPLYRPLATRNLVGRDVRMVADNLKALGYRIGYQPRPGTVVTVAEPAEPADAAAPPADRPTPTKPTSPGTTADKAGKPADTPGKTVSPATIKNRTTVRSGDGVLTRSLMAAIKSWQRDVGMSDNGHLGVGSVVVLPRAVRIDALSSHVGDAATGQLMSVTSTAKVVTVQAEASDAASVERGNRVTVTLPDETEVPAKVTAVGTVLQTEGESPDAAPKVGITVVLDDPEKVRRIDSGELRVDFVGTTHKGVLAVPVTALLALSEGGYGVQLVPGGLVAVKTGLISKGLVEVSGAGLKVDAKVVTAA